MLKTKKEKIVRKKEAVVKAKKAQVKAVKPAKLKVAKKTLVKAVPKIAKKALIKPAKVKILLKKKPAEIVLPPKPQEIISPKIEVKEAAKPQVIPKESPKPQPIIQEAPKAQQVVKESPKPHHAPVVKAPIKEKEIILESKPIVAAQAIEAKEIELKLPVSLKDLAVKLQEKPSVIIKSLMDKGMMVGINQMLDEATVNNICEKFNVKIKKSLSEDELALSLHEEKDEPQDLSHRSPIVTIMGHVDHGKTSLLDAIRKSKVTESEHGGITQHIGAYRVKLARGEITFLDTPGHEAFTAMRAHGARITDIVVLVVAADDGIMPQTQEAIDHARAAGVPIIVAINKIDKPQANVDKVKKQLGELDLLAEDWGGKTITVGVSAKTGEGIDNLLEMILLEAEMLELKANPKRLAKGVVIEAKMSKGRGPVSTLLIQNGSLSLNDNIIIGSLYGKIRAMFDDHGHRVSNAYPSFPIEVLGISGIPEAGEQFFAIKDEKVAKDLALKRQEQDREEKTKEVKRISLEDLHAQIVAGKLKELKIIIKADVQGSLAAIKEMLNRLNVTEINLDIIHEGVGNINTSDAVLAMASNALILGFNVTVDDLAKQIIEKEGLDARTYNIIYELTNDIKQALEGMLEPKLKKVFLGRVEIRKVFNLSRSGIIAGSFVTKGKVNRNCNVSLVRNGEVVFEGKLSSLKRFKDDVREVLEGFECGIALAGFDTIQEGDIIEAYEIEKIARKL